MWKNKKVRISVKRVIQGLPLLAVVGASVFVNGQIIQQLLMLMVFIWLQVFFIFEVLIPT